MFAMRVPALRQERTFAAVIVGTLALGIGANTAIFSIIDGLLLRTLPVDDPERFAQLVAGAAIGAAVVDLSDLGGDPATRRAVRRRVCVDRFDAEFDLSTEERAGSSTACGPAPEPSTCSASAGARPPVRAIRRCPRRRQRRPVVVISHAFWQTYFGGAPDVIGRTLTLERVPLTIVGVTPPGFFGVAPGRSFDVVVPLGAEPLIRGSESRLDRRTSWWLQVFVRLKHGQSIEAATALMQTLQPGIREATLPPRAPAGTWTGIWPTRSRSWMRPAVHRVSGTTTRGRCWS